MNNLPIIKTPTQVEGIRKACALAASTLDYICEKIYSGMSTGEINTLCHEYIISHNAIPAPLNYVPPGQPNHPPFPASVCTSVNHQVCHGIPSNDFYLQAGDIIGIDVTVILDNYYGDSCRTIKVSDCSRLANRICDTTYECLMAAIDQVAPGKDFSIIGQTIEPIAKKANFSIVRDYCGHGVGLKFHEPPNVIHFAQKESGIIMQENMVFTIEPMINAGNSEVRVLQKNGWTVITKDKNISAQFEHTVLVTATGAEILTQGANAQNLTV